jgi:hypothetical protein
MVHARQMTRLVELTWDPTKIIALAKKWHNFNASERAAYEVSVSDE